METSQPLAIESFSHSWLINRKPSLDDVVSKHLTTSISCFREENCKTIASKRSFEEAQTFNFDIPISQTPTAFAHADEIFSHGYIMPIYADRSRTEVFSYSNSLAATPISSLSSSTPVSPKDTNTSHCHFFRKWRKSSQRMFQKYFGFLMPLSSVCSRKSIRVQNIDRKVWEVKRWSNSIQASPQGTQATNINRVLREAKSWTNSPQSSPSRSPSYSKGDWYDVESSIHEAILHCKKSNGK